MSNEASTSAIDELNKLKDRVSYGFWADEVKPKLKHIEKKPEKVLSKVSGFSAKQTIIRLLDYKQLKMVAVNVVIVA